jgi:hypothetical protein
MAETPADKYETPITKNKLETVVIESEIHQIANHCSRLRGNFSFLNKTKASRNGAPTLVLNAANDSGVV